MQRNDDEAPTYTAEQVTQGHTVLRTPLRKTIFIGGLVLFVIFAAALAWFGRG